MVNIGQASSKRRRIVSNAKFGLDAEWASSGFGNQVAWVSTFFGWRWRRSGRVTMFRRVRVGTLDLDETFGTNCLIAATSLIEVWWVIQETDRTLGSVFVKVSLDGLAAHKRILGQLHFTRRHLRLRMLTRGRETGECLRTPAK